jgi:polysaccharide biosynthesis/export protein
VKPCLERLSLIPYLPKTTLSKMKNSRIYSPGTMKIFLLISVFILALQGVAAQQTQRVIPAVVEADTRYRIGAGDVLEVRVLRAPELSRDAVRVDQLGMIRMPMWNNDVPAACLTEGELAANIAKLYLKYKRDPHVDVFVKEFQSQPVSVTGAVHAASNFKLQRQVRLLEMLSLAGGPTESAGQTVQIVHASGPSLCDKANEPAANDDVGLVTYKLSDTLRGIPEANPYVRPGDVVQVLEADQVYIVGNVLRPMAIPLTEPLTVSRAIAIAGGTAPSTKKDKVRIVRQTPGSTGKVEIYVDLGAIDKHKAQDVALLANDIVDVPISGTKSFLRSLMATIVPAVSQLPVRVIP